MTIKPNEFKGMDGLRACACIAVFGVHLQQVIGASHWSVGPIELDRLIENGNTGVCFFFVLSGALLSLPFWATGFLNLNSHWIALYAVRRSARILPPYFLCLIALIFLKRHWQSSSEKIDSVLHMLLIHNYREESFYSLASPFWTVAVQAQFYLILPLILALLSHEKIKGVPYSRESILVCLIGGFFSLHICVMGYGDKLFESVGWNEIVKRNPIIFSHSLLAHLPHFVLGILTGRFLEGSSNQNVGQSMYWKSDLVLCVSTLMLLVTLGSSLDDLLTIPHGRYNFPMVPILLSIIIVATPRSYIFSKVMEAKLLKLLGKVSFGFYLYHFPIINANAAMFGYLKYSIFEHWLLFSLISFLTSFLVSCMLFFFFERPLLTRTKSPKVLLNDKPSS